MSLELLIEMQFGSHVYGTSLPTSDHDIKGVFVPPKKDILLQRVTDTISHSTRPESVKANRPGDTDTELFSLQKYLHLLLEGQTIALDMLFTPESFYRRPPHPVWEEIRREKKHFLHSGVSAFGRYCQAQAMKYGRKGNRIAALRIIIDILQQHEKLETVGEMGKVLESATNQSPELIRLMTIVETHRETPGRYLEVCGKKVPFEASPKFAHKIYQKALDQFGARAKSAEMNEGVDWKALSHAVRVAKEGTELLKTESILFPRPEKDLLLQIRQGKLPYEKVAEIIENAVQELNAAAKVSKLPSTPNRDFADELVLRVYGAAS